MGEEARYTRARQSTTMQPTFAIDLRKFIRRFNWFILETVALSVGDTEARECLREGMFRGSGRIHLQMYDRFNLFNALKLAGYVDVKVCCRDTSRALEFSPYCLGSQNSVARKPDSLYLEARK